MGRSGDWAAEVMEKEGRPYADDWEVRRGWGWARAFWMRASRLDWVARTLARDGSTEQRGGDLPYGEAEREVAKEVVE